MTGLGWARLELGMIAAALEATRLSRERGRTAAGAADADDESMGADATARLISAYRYLDGLLERRVALFGYGSSEHLLELNTRILCGVTPERRVQFAGHIAATTTWFYDRNGGDIGGLADWVRRNDGQAPRWLAAGAFVHIVSSPQLFIEGNRRTAALVASYLLARAGLPPLVVTADLYAAYQAVSEPVAAIERNSFLGTIAGRRAATRFATFLAEAARPDLLAPVPPTLPDRNLTIG